MMIYSDDAYSMSLIFYNLVKEMSRHGEANAVGIYKELQIYFKKSKHASDQPTEKDTVHNVTALIKGKRSGKVVVETEKPHLVGGKRIIIDKTRSNKDSSFKETEEDV
jgi:arginine utilization protein RocB